MSSMMAPWVLAVLMAVLVVGVLGVLVGVRVVAFRVEHHDPDATEAHANAVAATGA